MTAVTTAHRLTVGSINEAPLRHMLAGTTVDVLYTDPPWNDGMMKNFARLASRNVPAQLIPIPWRTLMEDLQKIIREHVHGWVMVEMGLRLADQAEAMLNEVCVSVSRHGFVYNSGKLPAALLVGHTEDDRATQWRPPYEGTQGGLRMVKANVASVGQPGQILLDPCCGYGYAAKAALAAGMTFYGNELDPARAQETRRVLEGS